MAIKTIPVEEASFKRNVIEALNALSEDADNLANIAAGLDELAPSAADPADMRRTAALARVHAFGMLSSIARIIAKAERLETLADVRLAAPAGGAR